METKPSLTKVGFVCISLPPVFYILDNLLIQVYNVVLHILIVFSETPLTIYDSPTYRSYIPAEKRGRFGNHFQSIKQ